MAQDRVEQLRAALGQFASPQEAMTVMFAVNREEVYKRHDKRVRGKCSPGNVDWDAVSTYLADTTDPPMADQLAYLSSELKQAILQRDQDAVFSLLLIIAKSVKPFEQY